MIPPAPIFQAFRRARGHRAIVREALSEKSFWSSSELRWDVPSVQVFHSVLTAIGKDWQ